MDINRCALIFEDIKSLQQGIELITNKIKNKECGVIVDIVRTKNGFIEYSHDAPSYADIKLNVLIVGKYNSVIGEIQFLLTKMMEFKKRAHSLYGVTRKEEFVENMSLVLPTMLDLDRALFVSGNEGDVKSLCNLMVTHNKQKEDLVMIDNESNESILHNICWLGHVKAFKFLRSILDKNMFLNRLVLPNRYNDNPIKGILENTDYEMMSVIFPKSINDNNKDKKSQFALELYQHIKSSKEEIWRIIQHAWTISYDMVQFVQKSLNIDDKSMIECCIMCESDFDNYLTNYTKDDGHQQFKGLSWLTSSMIGVDNVTNGANIDAIKYILSLVKKNGNIAMIDYLKYRDFMGSNIIAACVMQGYYDIVKYILDNECKDDSERKELISAVDVDGSTSIQRAFIASDETYIFEMVKYLLAPYMKCNDDEKMELLNMKSIIFESIWTRCIGVGRLEIAKYIYDFCPNWFKNAENVIAKSENMPSILIGCCANNAVDVAEWLLFELEDGKYQKELIMGFSKDGMSPLTKALEQANIEVAEVILSTFDDKKEALEYIQHEDKYGLDTLTYCQEILADYEEVLEEVEEWLNDKIKQLQS